MPNYKLTYFNSKGRAEVSRWIFAYAGVEYEDHRVNREEWLAMKPTTPFGALPILETGDIKICQSEAIGRYLARQYGLAGKSPSEEALVDMVVGCLGDVISPVIVIMSADQDKKEELIKKFAEEQLPEGLRKLENLLKTNNGGDGFFVGDSVTWADFMVTHGISVTAMFKVDLHLENFPKLQALMERVKAIPAIAAWIAKSP